MNISLQVKEAHLVITNDTDEIGYAYSVKDLDMNINPVVLINMAGELMKAFNNLVAEKDIKMKSPEERGFTTYNKGMPKNEDLT